MKKTRTNVIHRHNKEYRNITGMFVGYLDRATNKSLSSGKSTFGQVRIYIIFRVLNERRRERNIQRATPTLYRIIERYPGGKGGTK